MQIAHLQSCCYNPAGPELLLLQERRDSNFNVNSAMLNDTVDSDIVRQRYEEVNPLQGISPTAHIGAAILC